MTISAQAQECTYSIEALTLAFTTAQKTKPTGTEQFVLGWLKAQDQSGAMLIKTQGALKLEANHTLYAKIHAGQARPA
ncbi:hypothetical protein [Micavibrio aeruginosavorus]|uniref:hypothetical protein n=1 Tax=Micavibrio aeruginosavorus TaxID=349221 RepID=UPI003F4A8A4F